MSCSGIFWTTKSRNFSSSFFGSVGVRRSTGIRSISLAEIWSSTNPKLFQNTTTNNRHIVQYQQRNLSSASCVSISRQLLESRRKETLSSSHRTVQRISYQNYHSNERQEDSKVPSSDPPILSWVDDYLPENVKPYARLARIDKPIGTWLLLWPCAWSTSLATAVPVSNVEVENFSSNNFLMFGAEQLPLLGLFAAGAFIMRGAGCTINDLWDQDVDSQVARTATRPLAAGDINTSQAIAFLGLQLTAGLGVLLSLPHLEYTFLWGAASLPLVVSYPLMKRFTNFPQLVLGLTFNWGAWMGWAAVHGSMDYSVIAPLYGAGVTWTLVYDTIYANQDKTDDAKLGLKSTALTFGRDERTHKRILHGFALATYLQWLFVGYSCADLSMVPYGLGVSSAYAHLFWQIHTAELDNPVNLAKRFRSNTTVGAIIFGSIATGKLL